MSIAIQTTALSRNFKTYDKPEGLINSVKGMWNRKYIEKPALSACDISIEQGQIVGLVGANGAGKTTLLKLLSGLIHPTSGDASVLGFRPWERKSEFLKQMSILLGQKNQLWWDIPPLDSFSLLTQIYDLDEKKSALRVEELSELLDCKHVLKTQLRRLSLGERMKMEIIGSLLHEPRVLFLDEPTIGLDIVAQSTIRKFLAEYARDKGPTVILTSHYMDDIAKLSDRLLLISKGSIVYDGTVHGFVAKSEQKQKITFTLQEALLADLVLEPEIVLLANNLEQSVQVLEKDLSRVLSKITGIQGIQKLKIEEADFEGIIHTFLEAESRVRKTRGSTEPRI